MTRPPRRQDAKRHYATGSREVITPEVLKRIREGVETSKITLQQLEQRAGLASGAATKILSGKQQTTNHLARIYEVLGLDTAVVISDPDEISLLEKYRSANAEGRKHLLGVLGILPRDHSNQH
jgi:hypothetical protein